MAKMGSLDKQEGDEATRAGMALLQAQFARLGALAPRRGIKPTAGTSLFAADEATPFARLSNLVDWHLGTAEDHLETVKSFVQMSDGGLTVMSYYTLIRSALEASAYALYLLAPDDHNERVLRALQMGYRNRKDVESLAEKMGKSNPQQNAKVRARFDQIKDEIPELRERTVDSFPSMTKIVEFADDFPAHNSGAYSAIVAWKACSGIAHGNPQSGIGMLERRQLDEGDGVGASYWVTSSALVVAFMMEVALNLTEAALDRLDSLNNTSSNGEPIT